MKVIALVCLCVLSMPGSVFGQTPDFGWISDGRRFGVGDIVTIVVDELTTASADRTTSALENRSSDLGVGFRGSGSGQSLDLGTLVANQSSRRGRDIRQDRMSSEVSVRVTEVEPSGNLRVEGKKIVIIDEHEQEVTVRGSIRPQDVSSNNTVESWRVAEAEVMYTTNGSLARPEKSFWMKILGLIVP